MKTKIKLHSKEANDFITMFSCVTNRDGKAFYYIPCWFEETDEEGLYEMHEFGKLPKELKIMLRNARSGINNRTGWDVTDAPIAPEDSFKE